MITITSLDNNRCNEYLKDKIKDWGYFGKKINQSNILSYGDFFCIVPVHTSEDLLYQFDYGGQIFSRGKKEQHDGYSIEEVTNAGEELFLSFTEMCINNKNYFLVMEDFLSSKNDSLVNEKNTQFYLAESTVLYILGYGSNRETIEKYYYLASSFHFMPFFVSCELDKVVSKEEINQNILRNILSNIKVLFFQIYDGESFLIWIKDEESNLIDTMRALLKKVDQ